MCDSVRLLFFFFFFAVKVRRHDRPKLLSREPRALRELAERRVAGLPQASVVPPHLWDEIVLVRTAERAPHPLGRDPSPLGREGAHHRVSPLL